MKKIFSILLTTLLSCQLTVFADLIKIKTFGIKNEKDTIIVREFFGLNGQKIYGDRIVNDEDKTVRWGKERPYTSGVYGGNSFKDIYTNQFKNFEFATIGLDDEKNICIFLEKDKLSEDTTIISFNVYKAFFNYETYVKNNVKIVKNWCKQEDDFICCILIIVKQSNSGGNDYEKEQSDSGGNDYVNNIGNFINWTIVSPIIVIICLLVLIFVLINRLSQKIHRLDSNIQTKIKQSESERESIDIEGFVRTVLSRINSKGLAQNISNDDVKNVIKRKDIQNYIQTIIAEKADEYLRSKGISDSVPSDSSGDPVPSGSSSGSTPLPFALRTTKVKCVDNNYFEFSEDSTNKIFEIYSENGEYYYTIVNDPSIRQEMLGSITGFSSYIKTIQVSEKPTTLEVIRAGRLIQMGDRFLVDRDCILQCSMK